MIFFPLTLLGAERYQFYRGARSLGMGGATVAVTNDETALLSNPAGMGKLRDTFFTILDPDIDSGSENGSILAGKDFATALDPQGLLPLLIQNPGRHFHLRTQIFPSIVLPNFGFGVFAKYASDAEVDSAITNYRLDYTNDYAAVIGFNLSLFDGRFKFGFNGRFINRVEIAKDLNPAGTGYSIRSLAAEGGALASDVGIILTGPWTYLPTIAAVVRDVGNTTFNMSDGYIYKTGIKPATVQQSVDVALAIFPIHGNYTRSALTLEYQDILTGPNETDQSRRYHVGYELNIYDLLFIRTGMNQRYWTAGLEFAITNFQFQLATYGEEIGTADAHKEDRRFDGKLSIRF